MILRLSDLKPVYQANPPALSFQRPLCRKGVVNVRVREGEAQDGLHGCNALPVDFETVTITPSIADEGKCSRTNRGCPGWHGFITNGEVS